MGRSKLQKINELYKKENETTNKNRDTSSGSVSSSAAKTTTGGKTGIAAVDNWNALVKGNDPKRKTGMEAVERFNSLANGSDSDRKTGAEGIEYIKSLVDEHKFAERQKKTDEYKQILKSQQDKNYSGLTDEEQAYVKYAVNKEFNIEGINNEQKLLGGDTAQYIVAPKKSSWDKFIDNASDWFEDTFSGSLLNRWNQERTGFVDNKAGWTDDQLANLAVDALHRADQGDTRDFAIVDQAYERLSRSSKYKDSDLVLALSEAKKSWGASPLTSLGKNVKAAAFGMGADFASFLNSVGADQIPGINDFNDTVINAGKQARQEAATYNKGRYGENLGVLTQGIVNLIPYMLLGTGKATAATLSRAPKYATYIKTIAQNPSFWYSLTTMWGQKYQEALDDGASESEALKNAILYSVPAALVEVGGGIGSPDGSEKLSATILEEIGEGIAQDFISGAADKATTKPNLPVFSMTDDAIVNPINLANTAMTTVPIVAVAGGANKVVNLVNQKMQTKKYINDVTYAMNEMSRQRSIADVNLMIERVNGNAGKTVVEALTLDADAETINGKINEVVKALAAENGKKDPSKSVEPTAQTTPQSLRASSPDKGSQGVEDMRDSSLYTREADDRSFDSAQDDKKGETLKKTPSVSRAETGSQGFGIIGQRAFEANYREGQDADTYAQGFNQFYRRGFIGQDYKTADSETQGTNFGNMMSEDQKTAAYYAGVNDAKISLEQQKKNVQYITSYGKESGVVGNDIAKSYDKELIKAADRVAKALGVKIEFVNTLENGTVNGSIENGYIRIAKDAYHENMTAENIAAVVVGHEITHRMQELAPIEYSKYRNYVVENNPKLVNDVASAYAEKGVEISQADLYDEVAAEYTGYILKSPETLNRFIDDFKNGRLGETAEQNSGVFKQLWQAIKDFISNVKKAFKGDKKAQDKAARDAFGMPMSELEKARDLLGAAFAESERVVREKNAPSQSARQTAQTIPPSPDGATSLYTREADDGSFDSAQDDKVLNDGADGKKFSIKYTTDNKAVVIIEKDILQNVPESEWVKTVKAEMKKFSDGIPVSGRLIKVVKRTGEEYTNSGYSRKIKRKDSQKYIDKLKASGQFDEIVLASTNYVNEDLSHERKDNIREFARGEVLLQVGENQYSADVVIGFTSGRSMVLHDIVNLERTSVEYKKKNNSEDGKTFETNPIRQELSSKDNVPQKNGSVNTQFMQKSENNSAESRKSIKMDDVLKQNATLKKADNIAGEKLKELRNTGAQVDSEKLTQIAKDILDEFDFAYNGKQFSTDLEGLSDDIQQLIKGEMDLTVFKNKVAELCSSVVDEGLLSDSEEYEAAKELRNILKTQKVSVDEETHSLLGDEYKAIKKNTSGRFRLVEKDGTPLDVAYRELSEMFPECFDITKETSQADQLRQIAKILDDLWFLRNSSYIDTHSENVSMILGDIVVYKIFNEAFTSDSAKTSVKSQSVSESVKSILKEKIQEERRILKENSNPEKTKLSEEQKKKQRIRQISFHHKSLLKMLADYTRKSDVPVYIRQDVAKAVAAIDFITKDGAEFNPKSDGAEYLRKNGTIRYPKDFAYLKKVVEKIASEEYEIGMKLAPGLPDKIQDVIDEVSALSESMTEIKGEKSEINLKDLSIESLDKVYDIICNIRKAVFDFNQVIIQGKNMRASELAQKAKEEVEENYKKIDVRSEFNENAPVGKFLGGLDRLWSYDVMKPLHMMHRMGKTMKSFCMEIIDALDVATRDRAEDMEFLEKNTKDNNIDRWAVKDSKKIIFKLTSGKEIKMDKAQVMTFYGLMRQKHSRQHILENGIVVGKTDEKKLKVKRNAESFKISKVDAEKIIDTLADNEKKFVEAISQYFTDVIAKKGNEVSIEQYGIELFKTINYWPEKPDKNHSQKEITQEVSDMSRLKNLGIAQKRNPDGNNPLVIESVFDVFFDYSQDMALRHALLIPLENLKMVISSRGYDNGNDANLRTAIINKMGQGAMDYVERVIGDMNAGSTVADPNGILSVLSANVKKVAVAANSTVWIQQFGSIFKSLVDLKPQYLLRGMFGKTKADEFHKAVPISQWKDWGFSGLNGITPTMKDMYFGSNFKALRTVSNLKEKVLGGVDSVAGKFDQWAWKAMWRAVNFEIADTHKELNKNSAEFRELCRKRFNYVIANTQVVDTPMHKAQIMRSKNQLTKESVAFMNEPLSDVNIVRNAWFDFVRSKDGKKKALKKLAPIFAVGLARLFNACSKSVLQTWGEEPEDDEEKFIDRYFRNVAENALWDIPGSIPWVKDITSLIQGFNVDRTDARGLEKLINSIQMFGSDSYATEYKINQFFLAFGDLCNVPASSAKKTFYDRGLKPLLSMFASRWDEYESTKNIFKVNGGKKNLFMDILFEAYSSGQKDNFDKIRTDMVKEGLTDEDILNKVKNPFLDMLFDAYYLNDKAKYDEIVSDMMKYGYDAKSIESGLKSRKKDSNLYDTLFEALSSADKAEFDRILGELKVKEEDAELYNKLFEAQKANKKKEFDKILEEMKTEDVGEALAFRKEHGVVNESFGVPWDNKMEIPEKETPDKFDLDDLTDEQYMKYYPIAVELEENVVGDIKSLMGELDEETYNSMLSAAYNYVENVALERAVPDEYEIDEKWILDAIEAEDRYDIEPGEFIRYREEYGISEAAFEGYSEVVDVGVEFDEYLDFRKFYWNTSADKDANGKSINNSKKKKVVNRLNEMNLTDEEWDALFFKVAEYKKY